MKSSFVVCFAAIVALAHARFLEQTTDANSSACLAKDHEHRALIQTKLALAGIECEDMCKRIGVYPNCQCPGFEGSPTSDGDARKCAEKLCQDPKTPCPTEAFVTCVKEATKISVLQWGSLLQRVAGSFGAYNRTAQMKGAANTSSCQANDKAHRALLQAQITIAGIECEDMCKRIGVYPNCQCPGFEGSPTSDGDARKCAGKLCQDPKTPCPTEAFVTCVKEATKVSVLQWDALVQLIDDGLSRTRKMLAAAHH